MQINFQFLKTVLVLFLFCCSNTSDLHCQNIDSSATKGELENLISKHLLNYPNLTNKIYAGNKYKYLWFNKKSASYKKVWEAIDLLSTVPQYGLNTADYHCTILSPGNITALFESKNYDGYRTSADIYLTDALISFISNLHFGKVNPGVSEKDVDEENADLKPVSVLMAAMQYNDLQQRVLSVQPQFRQYQELQQYMKLMVAQYVGDCYEVSDEVIAKVALNLERWRWLESGSPYYMLINLPAFQAKFVTNKDEKLFNVIIGKPATPTPSLNSRIEYFTTSPDWVVPKSIMVKELLPKALNNPEYLDHNNFRIYDRNGRTIMTTGRNLLLVKANPQNYIIRQSAGCDNALGNIVFNFPNPYSIYLHDTPDKKLFLLTQRALSHGCIRIEHPDLLAEEILKNDNSTESLQDFKSSLKFQKSKRFVLKNSVPIYIAYFTCEVQDGQLKIYNDIYRKDTLLSKRLKFVKENNEY